MSMYERFYGFRERPFDLTPDPRYLYLTPKHREALAHLEYALSGGKGITVLVGEVGTGKTILLRAALARARGAGVRCAHLSNPTLTRNEFYELLAAEFHLTAAAALSKAQFLIELNAAVREYHQTGGVTALVVDEAQTLPFELLEEIRLLANTENDTEKLLQVILVGQPELRERLNEPGLRQLKQRVALRCTLGPLDLNETAAYIAGRIRIAGGDPTRLFTREAVAEVYERSQGVPRLISVICDNALVTGFASGVKPVGRQVVLEVCRDFDFKAATGNSAVVEESAGSPDAGESDQRSSNEGVSLVSANAAADPAAVEPFVTRRFTLFGNARTGTR